eukprot:TRINITY_DN19745_c0_g1_i1.p3 TRINITY_DN19745_c0_g1~~TRINITY_DN19745_c0_g1_i1.p3  ORF type:complete len:104 (+),score=1.15 TRINITY_DN19745_c0_g1_i1:244-555(+)
MFAGREQLNRQREGSIWLFLKALEFGYGSANRMLNPFTHELFLTKFILGEDLAFHSERVLLPIAAYFNEGTTEDCRLNKLIKTMSPIVTPIRPPNRQLKSARA